MCAPHTAWHQLAPHRGLQGAQCLFLQSLKDGPGPGLQFLLLCGHLPKKCSEDGQTEWREGAYRMRKSAQALRRAPQAAGRWGLHGAGQGTGSAWAGCDRSPDEWRAGRGATSRLLGESP